MRQAVAGKQCRAHGKRLGFPSPYDDGRFLNLYLNLYLPASGQGEGD
jgi:hypothetical protein